MQWDKCALIITSSVHVHARYTVLRDPRERMLQYMDAISWYIRKSLVRKIIVCDNTGHYYPQSLYQLAAVHKKELELLSFTGNHTLVEKFGKGYGEGEIMEFVMTQSSLLKDVEGFLKITGRLKLVNIDVLLRRSDVSTNYFMPVSLLRPRFMVPRSARACVEVRVYYVTKAFFMKVLLTAYKNVRDDATFFLEHAYHQAIVSRPPDTAKVKCFPVAPEITGMSGSNGWTFKERSRLKKILIRLVSWLGYIRPVYKAASSSDAGNAGNEQ